MVKKTDKKVEQKPEQPTQQIPQQSTLPELEKTKQDLVQMTELAKRAMADMQNIRRRHEEEKIQWIDMANANLIASIIPVLDNLNRAKQHVPKGAEEWFKGIEISLNQLKKVLEDAGLKEIQSLNQPFNPNLHQAVLQVPGDKDVIIEEIEKGYMLGNRVIRHAKVKTGNGEKVT